MRIMATIRYHDHAYRECTVEDCQRRYCAEHRLLWRECETAKRTSQGDRDVASNPIYELGDCPQCERAKRWVS